MLKLFCGKNPKTLYEINFWIKGTQRTWQRWAENIKDCKASSLPAIEKEYNTTRGHYAYIIERLEVYYK